MLTIEEFITKLRNTPLKWRFDSFDGRGIRATVNPVQTHCPISAVLGDPRYFWCPVVGGTKLGLTLEDAQLIKDAADHKYVASDRERAIRHKLLDACGLSED